MALSLNKEWTARQPCCSTSPRESNIKKRLLPLLIACASVRDGSGPITNLTDICLAVKSYDMGYPKPSGSPVLIQVTLVYMTLHCA